VKSCPYCQNPILEKEDTCPSCGAAYWEPHQPVPEKKSEGDPSQEEEEGCLSIILLPFLLAIIIALVLIMVGFIIQLITHFENNQIKILWIAGSILAGIICYRIFRRHHKVKK
jgi:hypothetical protein